MLKNAHSLQSLCLGPPPQFWPPWNVDFSKPSDHRWNWDFWHWREGPGGDQQFLQCWRTWTKWPPMFTKNHVFLLTCCIFVVFFMFIVLCFFFTLHQGGFFLCFGLPALLKGAKKPTNPKNKHRRNLRKLTLESCKARKAGKWKAEWTLLGCPRKLGSMVSIWVITPTYKWGIFGL